MFEILNAQGHVVDTANSLPQAQDVVTAFMKKDRASAPFNCRVAQAA